MGTLGEVEVPENFIEILKKVGKGCEEDCEKCDSFDDCIYQFISQDRYALYPDNILPEDVVDFIIDYHHEFWRDENIPFSTRIEVGEYVVISYGIIPEWDYARSWEPDMIAYRKCAGIDDASLGNKKKRYSLPL